MSSEVSCRSLKRILLSVRCFPSHHMAARFLNYSGTELKGSSSRPFGRNDCDIRVLCFHGPDSFKQSLLQEGVSKTDRFSRRFFERSPQLPSYVANSNTVPSGSMK
jgi:hypothetical protein